MKHESFYILNGVRRALASLIWHRKTVPAIIYREGMEPEYRARMRLDQLYSPKTTVVDDARLARIMPPIENAIEVEPLGSRKQTYSVPLTKVRFT